MSNYYQSPNNSQPFGPAPQPPQQPVIMVAANRNRALSIVMVVLMVLLVAALGTIGWLYFNRSYQGHAPVLLKNQDEIETTAPVDNEEEAPAAPQAAPAAPVTVTVPAPAGNSGGSNNSNQSGKTYETLTTLATRCTDYAYAGTNGSDFVSVCNDGGGYTYKAYVNDGYLERPATASGSGRFVVDASPHTIIVSGSAVFVQDSSGTTVLTVPMTNWRS